METWAENRTPNLSEIPDDLPWSFVRVCPNRRQELTDQWTTFDPQFTIVRRQWSSAFKKTILKLIKFPVFPDHLFIPRPLIDQWRDQYGASYTRASVVNKQLWDQYGVEPLRLDRYYASVTTDILRQFDQAPPIIYVPWLGIPFKYRIPVLSDYMAFRTIAQEGHYVTVKSRNGTTFRVASPVLTPIERIPT